MAKSDKQPEVVDFEKALEELEAIVKKLEAGNLPLDESLALFERGVALARQCKQKLAEAELKVTKLVKDKEGLFSEQPFKESDEG